MDFHLLQTSDVKRFFRDKVCSSKSVENVSSCQLKPVIVVVKE